MNLVEDNTCRLCLNNTTSDHNNAVVMGKFLEKALNLLHLNLNLNFSEKPIVCISCSNSLRKFSNFKDVCLQTEATIVSFINMKGGVTLSDVYKKIKGISEVIFKSEEEKICRFCLNLVENDFRLLKEDAISDLVKQYLPEVNLKVPLDPVLCLTCLEAFQTYITFVKNCSDTEEAIIKYRATVGTDTNGYVNITDVAQFVQKNLDGITNCNSSTDKRARDYNVEDKIKTEIYEAHKSYIYIKEENLLPLSEVKSENTGRFQLEGDKTFGGSTCIGRDEEPVDSILKTESKTEMFGVANEEAIKTDGVNSTDFNSFQSASSLDVDTLEGATETWTATNIIKKEDTTAYQNSPEARLYKCDFCVYSTGDINILKSHTLLHKINERALYKAEQEQLNNSTSSYVEEEKYKCSTCGYRTKYKAYLKRHTKKHNNLFTTNDSKESDCDVNCESVLENCVAKQPPDTTTYECDYCAYKTTRKYRFRDHSLIHKDPAEIPMFQCELCDFRTKWKNTFTKHVLRHKGLPQVKTYSCEVCDFTTKSKSYVYRHSLIHRDGQTYKCETCGYDTKYKSYLDRHVLTHKNKNHPKEDSVKNKESTKVSSYKCEMCDYGTNRKYRLKDHMLKHKDPMEIELFNCELCPYQTKWKNTLSKHALMHKEPSQVHMYSCDQCEFTTKSKNYINQHALIHKNPSEIEMHGCELCGFKTKTKNYLKSHMLSHVNLSEAERNGNEVYGQKIRIFKCDMCGYKAKRKWQLELHILRHKDPLHIQSYNCEVCAFQTKYRNRLVTHKLTHKSAAEVRMHKCDFCGFETKWKHSLKMHNLVRHIKKV